MLVAVTYAKAERLYATINARAVDLTAGFGEEQSVSPKELPESEKAERWREVWFKDVVLVGADG